MKVIDMTAATFWKGESKVQGSILDKEVCYSTRLYIKGSQVRDYSCSCTTGSGYRGMCEHAELLLKHYQDQADKNGARSISTSQEVRTMIREYTNRDVAQIISSNEEERVLLVPRLLMSRQQIQMEFRIGRSKLYVLKDLAAFAQAVEHGSLVEYGKNLAFHHNVGVFAPESRALVEFVLELVNTYQEHYKQFQKNSFSTIPSLRELNLSKANRDRFFEIMMGQRLELSDYTGQKRLTVVRSENPQLEIKVERSGRDGIQVSIPTSLMSFTGERSLYLADRESIWRCDEEYTNVLRVFMEQMIEVHNASYMVQINEKDIPLFYERVLKKLEAYGMLKSPEVDLESYKPEELKVRFEFDSPDIHQLNMVPTLSYGSYSFHPVEDEKVPRTICRNVPGEFAVSQLITRYFKYKDDVSAELVIRDDEDAMYHLLTQGIREFMAAGEVYLSEAFKKLRVLPPPKISVGVRTAGTWLELKIDADGMSGTELARILSGYKQKKKYYRLTNGEFLHLEDQGFMTIAKLVDGLLISKSDLQEDVICLPRYRALYLDSILKEYREMTLYRDNLFKAVVRGMKSVEDNDFEIPPTLMQILRGYQKTGFHWLKTLDHYGFGGILADDMGLGKTIQVIAVLLDEASGSHRETSLIVCPASLVYNWENEIHMFAPALRALTVTGDSEEREMRLASALNYDVIITSYDLLKRDIEQYRELQFCFQVLDEAQFIKNASTQSAKTVKLIQARTRFALTGTPVENRISELWSIFDYLMPGFLFGYSKFKKEFETPIVKDQDKEALLNLQRMIGPFILRRLKSDVLKELPEKLETVVYSKFEKDQKELYAASVFSLKQKLEKSSGSDYHREKLQILAELTKLRQICCDPGLCYSNYKGGSAKLETCIDLLLNGVEGGHKIILFSQFTSMLDVIGERLTKEEITYYMLTGSTSKEDRIKMVNAFHKDEIPVFLISLKAGGTGLNLTAADIVIHYDPWWNAAAQNQATDRAHRIGQEKQVSVFKLITKDTIEENILKLQESKKNLADQIITEGTVSLSSLTKEDLLEILT